MDPRQSSSKSTSSSPDDTENYSQTHSVPTMAGYPQMPLQSLPHPSSGSQYNYSMGTADYARDAHGMNPASYPQAVDPRAYNPSLQYPSQTDRNTTSLARSSAHVLPGQPTNMPYGQVPLHPAHEMPDPNYHYSYPMPSQVPHASHLSSTQVNATASGSSSSSRSPAAASASASRSYPCDLCSQTFTRAHDRKRHREIHTRVAGQSNHACPYCHKTFSRQDALKRHCDNYCEAMTEEQYRLYLDGART